MQISNKYDLLQYFVEHMDSNNRYHDAEQNLLKLLNPYDQSQYLSELKNEGFINVYLGSEFQIYSKAVSFLAERKTSQSKAVKIKAIGKSFLRWVAGVFGCLLVAYLIWRFGWK